MVKEMIKKKDTLIGEAHGYEIYMTPECEESIKKLGLTEEKEKELISKSIDGIARTVRKNKPKEE